MRHILEAAFKQKSPEDCDIFGAFLCWANAQPVFGAQDWTRTSILFTVLPPQGSASTNFATWA